MHDFVIVVNTTFVISFSVCISPLPHHASDGVFIFPLIEETGDSIFTSKTFLTRSNPWESKDRTIFQGFL